MFQPHTPSRPAVERALAELLDTYAGQPQGLSAWDRYCLGGALTMMRFGYYAQALRRIDEVMDPPIPLPRFPSPRPLTVDDVRRAIWSQPPAPLAVGAAAGD